LATRLFSSIEKKFGRRLPLSTLYSNGTIALQAVLLDSSLPMANNVVVIQQSTSGHPLFLIHSMDGEVSCWRPLVQCLNTSRPIFGLRPLEKDGTIVAIPDIPTLARHHVESICRTQAEGTYYLAAYSYGGKVALEIAQQLIEMGKKVSLLLMIEAGPGPLTSRTAKRRIRLCGYFLRNLGYWISENLLQATRTEVVTQFRLKGMEIYNRTRRLLNAGWEAARKKELEDIFGSVAIPGDYRKILEIHYRGWQAYHALPYAGRVTLIRSQASPLFHSFEPDMGWSEIALGGVDVKFLPGHHWNIMREPKVKRLVGLMKAALDEADATIHRDNFNTPRF
jgi:thioesterase domain-containing protein